MTFENCVIIVNDLFDELSEENKRLFNELLFANKCLNKLQEFKYSFDLYSNKIKQSLESNEWQILEKLLQELNGFLIRRSIRTEINDLTSDDNKKTEDVLLPKIETSDQSIVCGLKSRDHYMDCEETKPSGNATDTEEEEPTTCDNSRASQSLKSSMVIPIENDLLDNDTDNSELKMKCTQTGCGQTFTNPRKYSLHMNKHWKEKNKKLLSLSDTISGNEITNRDCGQTNNDQTIDLEDGKSEKALKCLIKSCGKVFTNYCNLQTHIRYIHLKDNQANQLLKCDQPDCQYETRSRINLKKHKMCCHSEKNLVCTHPDCDFRTYNQSKLKRHLQTHGPGFECTYDGCDGKYTTQEGLYRHMKSHTMKMEFKCTYEGCDKVFRAKVSLNEHINSKHTKSKQWHCEWPGCDYTTYLPTKLSQHSVVHITDYKFVCDYNDCNAKYKTKKDLTNHKLRVHDKVRRFTCSWPGCTFTVFNKQGLKKHELIHTGEKPFACDWPGCQYRTYCKSRLKCEHMKKHIKN